VKFTRVKEVGLMENIKHNDLLGFLSNIKLPNEESFNRQFLFTKKEGLVRDLLMQEVERAVINNNADIKYIAFPEWKNHDFVLLERTKQDTYIPKTLIEFKYATSPFILGKQNVDLSETLKSHDSIWMENYRPNTTGYGRGVKADILKMNETAALLQQTGNNKPTIHQVIILLIPVSSIKSELFSFIQPKINKNSDSVVIQNDFLVYKNQIKQYHNNFRKQILDVKDVIGKQFNVIQQKYFPDKTFITEFTSLSKQIGKAFGTELEMHFFVISQE
jgi:hypothetical protein